MRIKVLAETKVKEGIAKASGRPYQFRLQAGVIEIGQERRVFYFEVPKDQPWHVPGDYDYTPELRVNQYGELELGRNYTIKPAKAA